MPALTALEQGYAEARADRAFRREIKFYLHEYVGRETLALLRFYAVTRWSVSEVVHGG